MEEAKRACSSLRRVLSSIKVEWLPLLKAFSLCLSRIPCSGLRGPKHSEDKEGNEVKPIQCKASSLIEYSSVEYGTRGPTRKALPAYHFEFQGASLGGSLMDMGGQSTLPGLITDTPRNQCGLVEARESERRKPAYSFFSSSSYPIMTISTPLGEEFFSHLSPFLVCAALREKYQAFTRFVMDWMMERPASRVLPRLNMQLKGTAMVLPPTVKSLALLIPATALTVTELGPSTPTVAAGMPSPPDIASTVVY
ncbi:UNVERIFIED_CONTAM: hypothetical protein Scaly_2982000 [Sesamum calycinum]|uniref:Uncharacterized protein n=1 Tax=Sesamum calycinum TaxID=2727403 RepID=A0AAW2KLW6_9LAMI